VSLVGLRGATASAAASAEAPKRVARERFATPCWKGQRALTGVLCAAAFRIGVAMTGNRYAHADAGGFMGLDIGGTLTKLAFLDPWEKPDWCDGSISSAINASETYGLTGKRDTSLSFSDDKLRGTVHLIHFSSDRVDAMCDFVKARGLHRNVHQICTAGGGAFKHAKLFKEKLGIELVPVDELAVVVWGISWLAERQPDQVYELDATDAVANANSGNLTNTSLPRVSSRENLRAGRRRSSSDLRSSLFPFLLVNIGSGVSIVRVDGPTDFKRVSGTALGGGTYLGLCELLTHCGGFDAATKLAAMGDASTVNLLVRDIYGGDYHLPSGAVLPGSLTASFFAKAGKHCDSCDDSSVLRALNAMISQNICQIAYLNAQIQRTSRIVFTGNFLRQNVFARETIANQMHRMSLAHPGFEDMRALFLAHEGYFGALGTLLHSSQPMIGEQGPLPFPRSQRRSKRRVLFEHCSSRKRGPWYRAGRRCSKREWCRQQAGLDLASCTLGTLVGGFLVGLAVAVAALVEPISLASATLIGSPPGA